MDFAGGLVIHTAAGVSALAAALVIGPRKGVVRTSSRPNSIPFVILGTAILWFGWFGFNAGSALAANDVAVNALVTTNLAAAAGGVSWMLVDWVRKGKPSAVGLCLGTVCALASATPVSGFVGPLASMGIGLVAGVLSNFVAGWRARSRLDDSLDVFACHGVGGMWGAIATGLFASTLVNAAGRNGLLFGNAGQVGVQLFAAAVVAAFAFVGSYLLLRFINIYAPVRVGLAEEDAGLDVSEFGEEAYDTDE
jgi:Amt family ammonium transporter